MGGPWPTDQRGQARLVGCGWVWPEPTGAALGPRTTGNPWTTAASDGQPTGQVSSRSKRSPRSPDHPDCLSHGGSQGFKSPHLHPTLMTSGNAGHRHVRGQPEGLHNGWRTPNYARSAPCTTPRPARCSAPSSGTSERRTDQSVRSATTWRALGGSRCSWRAAVAAGGSDPGRPRGLPG